MKHEEAHHETENLTADERRLSRLLKGVERREAPKDFDFHLKARLAKATRRDFGARFGWTYRYALPALALLVLLSVFVFDGRFDATGGDTAAADTTAPSARPSAAPNELVAAASPTPALVPAADPAPPSNTLANRSPAAGVAPPRPRNISLETRPVSLDNRTNSVLRGFRKDRVIEPPANVNVAPSLTTGNGAPVSANGGNEARSQSVNEFLELIGLKTVPESGRRRVQSVVTNSVGERSGVKAGDLVESLDDRLLTDDAALPAKFEGRKLSVRRGGEKVEIKLQN